MSEKRRAQLAVCARSSDVEDARLLLAMLGLIEERPRRKARRRDAEFRADPNDPRHGTRNGYQNLGCRCLRCRQAPKPCHKPRKRAA